MQKSKKPEFWPAHIDVAKNPENWILKSRQFFCAASALFDIHSQSQQFRPKVGMNPESNSFRKWQRDLSVGVPFIVCLAYSIELLLKAFLIQKDVNVIPLSGKIKIKNHDLLQMAKKAEISFSLDEQNILTRLRDYIEWGRYPTKVIPQEYIEPFDDPLDYHPNTVFKLGELYEPVFSFYQRLLGEYQGRRESNQ